MVLHLGRVAHVLPRILSRGCFLHKPARSARGATLPLLRRTAVVCASLALLLTFLGAVQGPSASAAPTANDPAYEYFFVVDTSGSMVGKGSGNPQVIFPTVQEHVQRFVDSLDVANTTLYLYTFDKGVGETFETAVTSDADKAAAKSFVAALQADGSMTYIYDTLSVVLDRAAAVRAADPSREHVQTIFLFTDGLDNSQGVTLQDIIAKYNLARGENEFLFFRYITLGTTAPAEWKGVEGAEVTEYPDYNLQDIMSVRVKPTQLDFGSLRDRDTSTRTLEISYDARLAGSVVKLNVTSEGAEAQGALVAIEPSEITLEAADGDADVAAMRVDLDLSISNKESLDENVIHEGRITFAGASGKLVTFSPGIIGIQFNTASKSTIVLEATDREALAIDLGVIDPFRTQTTITEEASTRVTFNDRAASSGAYLTARVLQDSGPVAPLLALADADGARVDQLKVTPAEAGFTVSAVVDQDAEPGEYVYSVILEPHAADVEGAGLTPGEREGEQVFTVSFTVPEPPLPTSVLVTRWVLGVLGGLLALAILGFVGLMLITGTGPGRLAKVLVHSLSPRILDSRLEMTKPIDPNSELLDITGKRMIRVGVGTGFFEPIPVVVTFKPAVSVTSASESLHVSIPEDAGVSLVVERAATGTPDYGFAFEVLDGDEISVEAPDGAVSAITVHSYDYSQ